MFYFTKQHDSKSDPQTVISLRAATQTQTDCFPASCLASAAPAHLVHPRGHEWGSKGAHRSVMRSRTATAFIWTSAHLRDTHLLHLKETRLSVENSYMLFIMCRGVESLSGNSDLTDEFSLEMSPRPNHRGRQLKIQSLQSRVGIINLGKHLS